MKRKWLMLIIAGFLLAGGTLAAQGKYEELKVYADFVKLEINGREYPDVRALVHEGTIYVPLRSIGERLGGATSWNMAEGKVQMDFIRSDGSTLIRHADQRLYQYIALEKNQLMDEFVRLVDKGRYDDMKQIVEQFQKLEELAGYMEDEAMAEYFHKLAFSAEVLRGALKTKSGKDYFLASQMFASTEQQLTSHLSSVLVQDQ